MRVILKVITSKQYATRMAIYHQTELENEQSKTFRQLEGGRHIKLASKIALNTINNNNGDNKQTKPPQSTPDTKRLCNYWAGEKNVHVARNCAFRRFCRNAFMRV